MTDSNNYNLEEIANGVGIIAKHFPRAMEGVWEELCKISRNGSPTDEGLCAGDTLVDISGELSDMRQEFPKAMEGLCDGVHEIGRCLNGICETLISIDNRLKDISQ